VAASTTSLPEQLGGVRNWDYRYSWLRDAAMNLYALFTLGYTDEAHAFMGWLERTTSGRAEDLQLMYGVGGERLLPEIQLDTLDGYRGSRPVRIGNAADQFQLDVYGYLLDTAWLYHRHGGPITPTFWRLLAGAVDVVARRWTEPDDGIWEVRGGRRHFVASKVMTWVAVDRAIRLARGLGLPADLDRWSALASAIRRQVEQAGVDPAASGAFTQAFGSRAPDAANLLLPLVRFLPPDDPRIRATVERTARELAPQGARPPLPRGRRRASRRRGELRDLQLLAGRQPRPRRPDRPGHRAVRAAARPRQRPGVAGRGDRPGQRQPARQLPPGLQSRRADRRRHQPPTGRRTHHVTASSCSVPPGLSTDDQLLERQPSR